ncbi:deazapurine DNA modification protein DpdA family protein [Nocardia sp. NPDC003979]
MTIIDAVPHIRIHGFGIKTSARAPTADSSTPPTRWPDRSALATPPALAGCSHRTCANCRLFALQWRTHVLTALDAQHAHPVGIQLSLFAPLHRFATAIGESREPVGEVPVEALSARATSRATAASST